MSTIMTRFCLCGKRASYGLVGGRTQWCAKCKPKEAIDIVNRNRKCTCGKEPSFNFKGETMARWCIGCKPDGAINVKKSKCECGKNPSFGLPGKTNAKWCKKCKPDNAVYTRVCKCGKNPGFNLPGETHGKWCKNCKPDGAILVGKKCECGKRPSFNLPGEKIAVWCSVCKPTEAIDVVHRSCEKCGKSPSFGLENDRVCRWCSKCKPTNAINVKDKMCKECQFTHANPKYKGYCLRCFIHLFPDKPLTRNYKVKERHVFDAVSKLLPIDIEIVRDKTVGGCSNRRPDLMIDCGSHWICAENDENCHKDYDTSCENKRTMELYTDMGNRPMILIRFNCDKYLEGDSLFKTCRRTGISLIRSKKEFDKRIMTFAELINKYIESSPPEKAVTVEYLYYDIIKSED